jgi:hypothetical protein
MWKKKPFGILVAAVALQCVLPGTASAYLDPNTGSYIFQVLVATFIGGLFTVKTYWQKIKDFLGNRFSRKRQP